MAERKYFRMKPSPKEAAYWAGFYKNFNRETVFRLTQTRETKYLYFYEEEGKMYEYFTETCFEPYHYIRLHNGVRTPVDSWAVPGCEPAHLTRLYPMTEDEFTAAVEELEDVRHLFDNLLTMNVEKGRRAKNIEKAEKARKAEEKAERKAAAEAAKKTEEERLAHEAAIAAGEIPPDPVTIEDIAAEAGELLRYTVATARESIAEADAQK